MFHPGYADPRGSLCWLAHATASQRQCFPGHVGGIACRERSHTFQQRRPTQTEVRHCIRADSPGKHCFSEQWHTATTGGNTASAKQWRTATTPGGSTASAKQWHTALRRACPGHGPLQQLDAAAVFVGEDTRPRSIVTPVATVAGQQQRAVHVDVVQHAAATAQWPRCPRSTRSCSRPWSSGPAALARASMRGPASGRRT